MPDAGQTTDRAQCEQSAALAVQPAVHPPPSRVSHVAVRARVPTTVVAVPASWHLPARSTALVVGRATWSGFAPRTHLQGVGGGDGELEATSTVRGVNRPRGPLGVRGARTRRTPAPLPCGEPSAPAAGSPAPYGRGVRGGVRGGPDRHRRSGRGAAAAAAAAARAPPPRGPATGGEGRWRRRDDRRPAHGRGCRGVPRVIAVEGASDRWRCSAVCTAGRVTGRPSCLPRQAGGGALADGSTAPAAVDEPGAGQGGPRSAEPLGRYEVARAGAGSSGSVHELCETAAAPRPVSSSEDGLLRWGRRRSGLERRPRTPRAASVHWPLRAVFTDAGVAPLRTVLHVSVSGPPPSRTASCRVGGQAVCPPTWRFTTASAPDPDAADGGEDDRWGRGGRGRPPVVPEECSFDGRRPTPRPAGDVTPSEAGSCPAARLPPLPSEPQHAYGSAAHPRGRRSAPSGGRSGGPSPWCGTAAVVLVLVRGVVWGRFGVGVGWG